MHNHASADVDTYSSMETIRESSHRLTTLVIKCFTSRFTFGDNSTTLFNIGVVLDPLSESAQKWSSLLLWLINIPGVSVDLRIHPNMYTEVSFEIFTSDPVMLIIPGPPQKVLSVQPQILRGVRPRRVCASFSETSSSILMSADKRLGHTFSSRGCHWNQSTLLRQMSHRPGWFVHDKHLMTSITSNYTQSLRKIVLMGFTQFSVSITSSSKDMQEKRSRPPLPVGYNCS